MPSNSRGNKPKQPRPWKIPEGLPLRKLLEIPFLAAALVLLMTACTTTPRKTEAPVLTSQSFSSDLFVERGDKSYKLKSEINVINDKAVRLDLNTTLDLPEASILLTDDKIQYALYRQKRYYSGRPNPHALDPVFPLSVDVDTLVKILREEKPDDDQCHTDSAGFLLDCEGRTGGTVYKVTWSKRKSTGPLAGRASKVVLDLPERRVSLRFYLNDWQKNVPNAERLLSLQIPPGFRIYSAPQR